MTKNSVDVGKVAAETGLCGNFVVTAQFGHSEIRSWLEAECAIDGSLRLVGMGSRTDFDRDGKITAHKVEPTGVVYYWPEPENRRVWWKCIFGA